MLTKFIESNPVTGQISKRPSGQMMRTLPDTLSTIIATYGGHSFGSGVCRIHDFDSGYFWETMIGNYFLDYKDSFFPFGFDWMGRQFAIDKNIKDRILMFDPATAEVFQLHESLEVFHNEMLVDDREATLSEGTFYSVLGLLKSSQIDFDQCLGYKKPLLLGGLDVLENYEQIDMEVYWDIQSQLYHQIKDLPPGTKINKISFD